MPPKGVILFNVSGTGKTFLVKQYPTKLQHSCAWQVQNLSKSTWETVSNSSMNCSGWLRSICLLLMVRFFSFIHSWYLNAFHCSYSLPDPTLIRPGRIDHKIEFPLPDVKMKLHFRYLMCYTYNSVIVNIVSGYIHLKWARVPTSISLSLPKSIFPVLRPLSLKPVTKADFAMASQAREKVWILLVTVYCSSLRCLLQENEGTPSEGLYL